ncbi:hypothetical protein ACKVWC_011453 [Pyricularia oryzae]
MSFPFIFRLSTTKRMFALSPIARHIILSQACKFMFARPTGGENAAFVTQQLLLDSHCETMSLNTAPGSARFVTSKFLQTIFDDIKRPNIRSRNAPSAKSQGATSSIISTIITL